MIKSKYKGLLGLFVIILTGFGLYAYKYHSLAMEGWRLFNDRCNNVNPSLIRVRNLHLGLGAAMSGEAKTTATQFEADLNDLPDSLAHYLELEKAWLDKQGAYITRWDFRILEPKYLKIAGQYQLSMYQTYYDYYEVFYSSLYAVPRKYATNSSELMDIYLSERYKFQQLYFKAFEAGAKIKDWKKIFARVPLPDCDPASLIIPQYYSPTPTLQPSTENANVGEKT